MQETVLQSNWDIFLYAGPLVALLLMSVFRLEEYFAAPKPARPRRPVSGMDSRGEPMLSDPDGRPWPRTRRGS